MDKQHFVSTMPLQMYLSLKKWLYFSIFVSVIFLILLCITELPIAREYLGKKSLYDKQKNIYAQEQELVVQEQSLEKVIAQLKENKRIFTFDKESIIPFLNILLQHNEQYTIVSIKKTNHTFVIEGTSNQMESITTVLKNVVLKTGYAFRIQSIEHKNKVYFFHAICYKKQNNKKKM